MKRKTAKTLGVVGAGKMGAALIHGLVKAGVAQPDRIWVSDPARSALEQLKREFGVHATRENAEVAANSDIVLIAVKPDVVTSVLQQIRPSVRRDQLIISIAAGIPLRDIEEGLGRGFRVVRVMPNTPCLVGESAAGFSLGRYAKPEDGETVQALFGAVGRAFELDERHLDAVTGLAASGPAYVFMMIEALSDGGVKVGLPRQVATRLAAQTVLGAAKMVLETQKHPGELKDQVTSPGGTTIAGLHALEARAFGAALIEAVEAATRRAKELARGSRGRSGSQSA